MKFLGIFLLVVISASAFNVQDALQFSKGLFVGITAGPLPDLTPCLGDVTSMGEDVVAAVKDFESKTADGVKNGLKEIASAIDSIVAAMTQCKAAAEEVEKLVAMLKNFKSPISFVFHVGKNLVVNGVEIYHEIDGAITSYHSSQWETMGEDIGEALSNIFLKSQQGSSWEKTEYKMFEGLKTEEINAKFMGLQLEDLSKTKIPRVDYTSVDINLADSLPETFDATQKWPNCIHPIRNQLHCGSCWAFSGSEVLSDRMCIASQGKVSVVLSPQYMISCDTEDLGCRGGSLSNLWEFLSTTGTTLDSCTPYSSGTGTVETCPTKCSDNSEMKMYKAKEAHTFSNIESIKAELMANGPIQTGFMVYKDFLKYKSGVYTQESNEFVGGHAVKIVGWGTDNGIEYWKVANSWGPTWGEEGFFRIKQGIDNIDTNCMAGTPDLSTA